MRDELLQALADTLPEEIIQLENAVQRVRQNDEGGVVVDAETNVFTIERSERLGKI